MFPHLILDNTIIETIDLCCADEIQFPESYLYSTNAIDDIGSLLGEKTKLHIFASNTF